MKYKTTKKTRAEKGKSGIVNQFDCELVDNLKYLISTVGAKIVISSSWRHNMERVQKAFGEAGLDWALVIGRTPSFLNNGRGNEVLTFLLEHNKNTCILEEFIEDFVMIDDDDFDSRCVKRLGKFVHTRIQDGLTHNKAQEVINIFNNGKG